MEKVEHLWNVIQYLKQLDNREINGLQTFYVEACRNLGNQVELPTKCFGPSVMCSHCGALWSTIDHQVRIIHGRKASRSIDKIRKLQSATEHKLPKVRSSLLKKCQKNEMNKVAIKCSNCLRCTEIPMTKPVKEKKKRKKKEETRKKKKKGKDKTVGLNISGCLTPESLKKNDNNLLVANASTKRLKTRKFNNVKSVQPIKKLNISKLKEVVNQCSTPPTRKSLLNFLKELT